MEKERVTICPSSPGINVRYRSILESIGSHYLSSVTYLSCYGCDCCQRPGRLCVIPGLSFIELEKRRRLASPNKEISPPNKSMLTVCLPRLGDSPTLWFLIRHIMRRREIGIWVEDCCMGLDWFDCVCISSASIDGNDFDPRASCCHPYCKPSQVENACISHSYFNKPLQPPYKDGEIIFSLLIEPDVDKASTMKTEDDGEKKKSNATHFPSTWWKWIFEFAVESNTPYKTLLILIFITL